jgi:hypothetical protein
VSSLCCTVSVCSVVAYLLKKGRVLERGGDSCCVRGHCDINLEVSLVDNFRSLGLAAVTPGSSAVVSGLIWSPNGVHVD